MSEATETTPTPADAGNKPWILIVDDSRVVRKTIINALGPSFHILEAGDGVAGFRMLRQNSRIEVVISDIQMPEMDGYGLICKVRAVEDPGMREIPIIVITSAEDDITRERAYACGANDFILKPFNTDQLLNCVRAQMSDSRNAEPALTTTAPAPEISKPAPKITPVVVADTIGGSIETAMEHLDTGLNMLRGLKTVTIAPHALALVLRFMPLLKYCNTKYNLGMDKEIAVFQQKIAAARAAKSTPAPTPSASAPSQTLQ